MDGFFFSMLVFFVFSYCHSKVSAVYVHDWLLPKRRIDF